MFRKKSKRSRKAGAAKVSYSELISVGGGKFWHSWILVVVIAVAGITIWLDPGVTRPYPGFTVLLGGLAAMLAGALFPFLALTTRSRVTLSVVLCLLAWTVACCPGSIDRFRSLQTLAAWIGGAGLFVLVSLATSSGLRWYLLVLGLTVCSSVLCLYGFAHMVPDTGISATFSNCDSFSVLPLISLFLALSMVQHPASPIRTLAWAQVALFGLTLVRTTSRSAIVGLLVGMVVVAILSSLQPDKKKSGRAKVVAIFLPLIITMMALATGLLSPLSGRVSELTKGKDTQGVSMREDVLVHGLITSMARPVLGSGPGTFALAYQEYRPQGVLPDYMYVNVAHNDYVEMAVELGWPGFCLFGLLWLLVLLKAVRLIRHKMSPWEACCCAGGVSSLLGFSLLNFILSIPCLLFWEFIALALLHSIPSLPAAAPNKIGPKLVTQGVLLFLLGAWATRFGYRSVRAERLAGEAADLLVALRWEEALPKLDQALQIQPDNPNLYLARGNLKARQSLLAEKKTSPDTDQDFEKAWHLTPRDLKVSRGIINYYQSTGRLARAEEILKEVNTYRPYFQGLPKEMSRVQLLQKKYQAAAETLHEGLGDDLQLRSILVPVLVDLEVSEPNGSIRLLKSWSEAEGETNNTLSLAKELATECIERGDPKAASRVLEFAQAQAKDDEEIVYLWSRVYAKMGKPKEQLSQLELLMDHSPTPDKEDRFSNLALADWARLQPDFLKPGPTYRLLAGRLKVQPGSIALRLVLSEILLRRKQGEAAIEVVTQGLDSAPDNPSLLARLGTCSQSQGLAEVATGYFEQALRLDPKNEEARRGLAKKPPVWH